MVSPTDELARALVELYRLSVGDREDRLASDAYFWANERVSEIVAAGGAEAVEVLNELLHADGADETYIAALGAGPLENLLYSHGSELATLVEERCRLDPAWRAAISAVMGHELPISVKRTLRLYMPTVD